MDAASADGECGRKRLPNRWRAADPSISHDLNASSLLPHLVDRLAVRVGICRGRVSLRRLRPGADLNGTASLNVSPPLVVTGQSDLPATIAAGVPAVTDKLAWGAIKE
jgi:hypothetical protein